MKRKSLLSEKLKKWLKSKEKLYTNPPPKFKERVTLDQFLLEQFKAKKTFSTCVKCLKSKIQRETLDKFSSKKCPKTIGNFV